MEPDRKMASASAVLRVYWAHMVRYPWWCALAIVCTVGMQAAELAGPWYLRRFFNIIATRTPEEAIVNQLLITVAILGVIWVAQLVATRTQYRALMYVNVGVMKDLFGTAFEYLIGHSYTFFISRFAGSLTHRVSKFARAYETLTDSIIMEFFPTTLFIIGAVAILFSRNHTLGIALATWSLVFIGFQIYVSKLRQPSRVAVAAADTKVTASLADAISNHVTITLFSGGTSERSRFSIVIGKWAEALTHVWTVDHRIWAGIGALQITLQVGLLYGATIFWSRGLLTIGDFVLIQSYILITFTRLTSINRTLRRFYDALADAQEFVAILEEPHSVQDVPDAPALAVAHGAVDFKDVS
ncbi:ABC transporter ATP-binding protein, partial [Candidatus Kaiserbacteria bacterium]|nr:ABC transporter ATP-binding protein [Candidatus Kaiserbacteria bacterium]